MAASDNKTISVFLVDDHPIVCSGVESELQKYSRIHYAGEASNGKEAIEKVTETRPDVILIDISMPDMTGLELTEIILKKIPDAKIIALTMHDNEKYVNEIIGLGAMGYVLKDSSPQELVEAIESVHKNIPYYSPRIKNGNKHNGVMHSPVKYIDEVLSRRECEILELLTQGCSNREIAAKLFISPRTVESHRIHIMQKLNARNFAELVRYAVSKGA